MHKHTQNVFITERPIFQASINYQDLYVHVKQWKVSVTALI